MTALLLVGMLSSTSPARTLELEQPGPRSFIRDVGNMIDAEDAATIKAWCDQLLTDEAVPIVVVTIETMEEHGGGGLSIESFATLLFDQWGIGHEQVDGKPANRGILLLVSKYDRKARIEFGRGWGHRYNAAAQSIMNDWIIPEFKEGNFSAGITFGVQQLDQLARRGGEPGFIDDMTDHKPPAGRQPNYAKDAAGQSGRHRPPDTAMILLMVIIGAIAVLSVVSFVRSGQRGLGWMFWSGFFRILGWIIYVIAVLSADSRRRRRWRDDDHSFGIGLFDDDDDDSGSGFFSGFGSSSSGSSFGGFSSSSGGGFSGGSFGGGSSGGGGASGSW